MQLAILALALNACQAGAENRAEPAPAENPSAAAQAQEHAAQEPSAQEPTADQHAAQESESAARPPSQSPALGPVDDAELLNPELIIAQQGDLTVTMDDFLYAIAWREWMNNSKIEDHFGDDWLSSDETVSSLVLPLLGEALLRAEAERFEVSADEDQVLDALRRNRAARDYMVLDPELREDELRRIGLSTERIKLYAADPLLLQAWSDRRVEMITDEDRWTAYARRNSLVSLDAVLIPNVHRAAAVNEFLATRGDEVETRYRDRSNSFMQRRRAHTRVIRLPFGDDPDVARSMIEALRERALTEGTGAIVSLSSSASALTDDGREWVTDQQLPGAFEVPVGEIGPITHDRRGFYFVENFEIREPELRPLDDTLRREIAQAILRETGPSPESMARAERIFEAFRAGDEVAVLAEERLSIDQVPPFPRSAIGVVPHIGQAPELSEAAFAEGVEAGDLIGPVHIFAGIVVARVTERSIATRADFEAARATFDPEFDEYVRENAWPARRAELDAQHVPVVNFSRIRAAYAARQGS